ncbi:MAG: hypothetical protein IPJ02_10275 [Chitinophagaceae bacterium]|nr:hypothetical protein [Chitinophagaceae bacterium]
MKFKSYYILLIAVALYSCGKKLENVEKWTKSSSGIPFFSAIPEKLFITNGVMYAGTVNDGVYRSMDGGQNWTHFSSGLPNGVNIQGFGVSTDNIVFALGIDHGIYSLTPAGSWAPFKQYVFPFDSSRDAWDMYVSGTTIMAADNAYDYYSTATNNGSIWGTISPFIIYAFTDDNPTSSGKRIYAGGTYGMFVSADGGANYTTIMSGMPALPEVNALHIPGKGTAGGTHIYAGTIEKGLYRAQLGTSAYNWSKVNTGMVDTAYITSINSTSDGKYIFVSSYYGGVYISRDFGVTWDNYTDDLFPSNMFNAIYDVAVYDLQSRVYIASSDGYIYTRTIK